VVAHKNVDGRYVIHYEDGDERVRTEEQIHTLLLQQPGGQTTVNNDQQPDQEVASRDDTDTFRNDEERGNEERVCAATAPASAAVHAPRVKWICTICLDEADASSDATTHCGHTFHHTCLKSWLDVGSSCPVCQRHLSRRRELKPADKNHR
jgi:hypothetical protein